MDKIVVIKDGEISEFGSYKDLIEQNGAFAEFIRTYLQDTEEVEEIDEEGIYIYMYSGNEFNIWEGFKGLTQTM